jgi:hypothetical protein
MCNTKCCTFLSQSQISKELLKDIEGFTLFVISGFFLLRSHLPVKNYIFVLTLSNCLGYEGMRIEYASFLRLNANLSGVANKKNLTSTPEKKGQKS